MLTIPRAALDQLAALLLERAGLKIAADGYHGLKLALSARMPAMGLTDAEEYVRRLKGLAGEHELRALLPLVTVGKTDFFRDARQFQALEKRVLPELLAQARAEGRKLSIWSAGCATGEEPYSLAVLLSELKVAPAEVDLWATDLNPAAVQHAQFGRYPIRRMTGLTEARVGRFFHLTDDGYEVNPELRAYVRFEGHNLAAPIFSKVDPASLDLILCRNVIIYFDLPTIRAVMDRFLTSLRPGGFLFLGYSESLFRVYDKFEMVEVESTFVYRRSTGRPFPRPPSKETPVVAAGRVKTPEAPVAARRPTGEEPARGKGAVQPVAAARPAEVGQSPVERLRRVIQQMDKGDFDGALVAAKKLAEEATNDLAPLLTLGNLYSLLGCASEAKDTFLQAISREPLCVEARVYGAMAAIQSRHYHEAKAELAKALFLEPTSCLGHYLMAQVLERLGDKEGARRAYRNALSQGRYPQRLLAGHYPDLPESSQSVSQAARYALAALEES